MGKLGQRISTAFAAMAMAGSAVAGSSAAYAGVYEGPVDITTGLAMSCLPTLDFYSVPGKAIIQVAPGDPLCAVYMITSNPHDYTLVEDRLTIEGFRLASILGSCSGSLSGTIVTNPDGSKTLIVNDSIPPESGGVPCLIVGELYKPAH